MDQEGDQGEERDFPSTRLGRGKVAASTGLKMGANYARYLARRSVRRDGKAEARKQLNEANARDLFSQVTKLRGTALKMAQGLSLETGFLPDEFAEILSQAQYSVPPMSYALARRIIKQELGDYPEDLFRSFESKAVAAASLGQVHRAITKDNRTVAVKVQYPNVRESINSDLKVMQGLAHRFVSKEAVDPYLKEIGDRLWEETDYRQEGQNIEFFAELYTGDNIITPRWIPELTAQRVLTMTFVSGRHLDAYLATDPPQSERDHYGQILWDFAHAQITGDQLAVHADAHPGNFLFRDDGKIGVLDFGCIKRFPKRFRDDLVRLFAARLHEDRDKMMKQYYALELLKEDYPGDHRDFLVEVLDRATELLIDPYRSDSYDFGNSNVLEGFQELIPKLTGREAFKYRDPVGSHHFVFVNRLVLGFFTLLTRLRATVSVAHGREQLLELTR